VRKISAIVPAAGLSRRFGGPNKLLQPWGDRTVVGSVVSVLCKCGLPVIVVTGRDAELVAEAVSPCPVVFNPNFEEGLGSSIRVGVEGAAESDGYLIALGDMPDLREEVIRGLVAAFGVATLDAIVAPVYAGEPNRPGHPVIFAARYREALLKLGGDSGAKAILDSNLKHLRLVAIDGRLDDIDLPTLF
jgi:molybdenum cofactor cytidylyltransferase